MFRYSNPQALLSSCRRQQAYHAVPYDSRPRLSRSATKRKEAINSTKVENELVSTSNELVNTSNEHQEIWGDGKRALRAKSAKG